MVTVTLMEEMKKQHMKKQHLERDFYFNCKNIIPIQADKIYRTVQTQTVKVFSVAFLVFKTSRTKGHDLHLLYLCHGAPESLIIIG